MIDQKVFSSTEERMKKSIEAVQREFAGIRAGRANPALLDKISVECYGSTMPIKQVANVSIPEARMIIIQPWDKTIISDIEKAIQKSDLGINPSNDSNVIRLIIPSLTEERRLELVKVVKKKTEEGKVSIRNIRRDSMEELKAKEKESSEDEVKKAQDQIQKITDKYIAELDRICAAKEKEIMEV
ncbi:MAG: ribosome recycling factor [Armatimonadota bacterium]